MANVKQSFQFNGSDGPWQLQKPFDAEEDGSPFKVFQVYDANRMLVAEIKPYVKLGWTPAEVAQINVRAMAKAGEMADLLAELANHWSNTDETPCVNTKDRVEKLLTDINSSAL